MFAADIIIPGVICGKSMQLVNAVVIRQLLISFSVGFIFEVLFAERFLFSSPPLTLFALLLYEAEPQIHPGASVHP